MKKYLVNLLAVATVGSFLLVGNAFATPYRNFDDQKREKVNVMIHEAFSHDFAKKVFDDKRDNRIASQDTRDNNWNNDRGNDWNNDRDNNCDNDCDNDSPGTAPVPEPATMLLFGTGLVGLVGVVRRKTAK